MKRIAIIGSGGSGKSTLAGRIGEILKLPVYVWNFRRTKSPGILDMINRYGEGKTAVVIRKPREAKQLLAWLREKTVAPVEFDRNDRR